MRFRFSKCKSTERHCGFGSLFLAELVAVIHDSDRLFFLEIDLVQGVFPFEFVSGTQRAVEIAHGNRADVQMGAQVGELVHLRSLEPSKLAELVRPQVEQVDVSQNGRAHLIGMASFLEHFWMIKRLMIPKHKGKSNSFELSSLIRIALDLHT